MTEKTMRIGFNTFAEKVKSRSPEYILPFRNGKGADFILCHFSPENKTLAEACDESKDIAEETKRHGTEFIANFEFQNWHTDCISTDGTK